MYVCTHAYTHINEWNVHVNMFHCGCHVCGVPLLNLRLLPSSPPADHRRPGEDRPVRLEDQHAPEALHEREQRGAVVLAGGGGLQRGEERAPPAVRHRLHQGALTRVQGAAGWVMDWLVLCSSTWLNRNAPPPAVAVVWPMCFVFYLSLWRTLGSVILCLDSLS